MGSGNRGGFVVDKGEASDCDFGLGLKMMMMGNHHDNHQSHGNDERGTKFVGFSGDHGTGGCSGGSTGGAGGGGCFGAMFSTNNNQESTAITTTTTSTTMYGLVGVGGVSPASCVASSVQRSPHAFDPSSFKSWGGALMGLGGGELARVFTASQRQELERQTIIYKYMTASMPIPPELLIPVTSKYSLPPYQSNEHGGGGKSGMDLRYTIGSRDAEPWRCRRTDGKKWRCSRDVAPDQKYCERHSHKGRPSRSRKHVESSSSLSSTSASSTSTSISIARNTKNNTLIPPSSSTSSAANPTSINIKPSFLYQPYQNPSHSRFPEWFMKREAHHHHDQSTAAGVPTASPFSPQTELDQMTPTHSHHPSRANNSLMGSDQTHSPTLPRQFLDAWSIGSKPDGIVEITGKPVDSGSNLLTLSMAGGGSEEAAAHLGMGLFEHERERDVGGSGGGGERYSWMGSPAPGGPLAEALCLGIVGADAGGSRGAHGHGESSGQGLGYNK